MTATHGSTADASPAPPTDSDLITGMCRGDEHSFRQLVARYASAPRVTTAAG